MSIASYEFVLEVPGYAAMLLSSYMTQEVAPEILDAVEKPAETNAFVAPEVSVKGFDDASKTVWTRLKLIAPLGDDAVFTVWRDYGTGSAARLFAGYVAPNTIQFDDQQRSFSFTAYGFARRLAALDATNMFKRTGVTGWTVTESLTPRQTITKAGATTCPFSSGDTLAFIVTKTDKSGTTQEENEELVAQVTYKSGAEWYVYLANPTQIYPAATPIVLKTPYLRNAKASTVVSDIFAASGLPSPTTHFSTTGPTVSTGWFTTPMSLDGLPSQVTGIVSSGISYDAPLATSQGSAFTMAAPPDGTWSNIGYYGNQPVAARVNAGMAYLYGLWWDVSQTGPPGARVRTYSWFAYRLDTPAPYTRYVYQMTIDNVDQNLSETSVTISLHSQTSADGYTWAGWAVPTGWVDRVFTTLEWMVPYVIDQKPGSAGRPSKSIGAAYVYGGGAVYFTEPYVSVAGGPVKWRLSSYCVTTNTTNTGLVDGVRGGFSRADLIVWSTDTLDQNPPMATAWGPLAGGLVSFPATTLPVPASSLGYTFYNGFLGGPFFLASDAASGTKLCQIKPGYVIETTQLTSPGPESDGYCDVAWLGGTYAGSGVVVVGGIPWWLSKSSSGIVSYLDCDGLSCADVLTQLAGMFDALWYVDVTASTTVTHCWFRTRQVISGTTVATGANPSVALDDSGLVSLRRQPLWFRTYRHVRVTNDQDETVAGEYGDVAFRGTSLGLEVALRYVSPSSYAAAIAKHIYDYLGRGLTFVDVEHEDDGRNYSVGRTFTLTLDGASKTFQIYEVARPLLSAVLRIQAVEL